MFGWYIGSIEVIQRHIADIDFRKIAVEQNNRDIIVHKWSDGFLRIVTRNNDESIYLY